MIVEAGMKLPLGAVDCHAHVIKKNAPLIAERHSAPARDCDLKEYLQVLDTHGVSYGLLTAPSFYGPNNEVLLDALKNANGRLRGTAIVEPTIAESELANMKAQGVCGLRLNWIRREKIPDITSQEYTSLLAKARNIGLHIEIYLEGEHLAPVLQVINRSGAQAVVDHFGNPLGPDAARSEGFVALLDAIDQGNTWVKLSAPYRLRHTNPNDLIQKILQHGKGERAVWATDWPWVGHENKVAYEQCIKWIFDWIPDETIRHTILVKTPQTLFGFPNMTSAKS
jgi:predicted TIM-barrel fold metal-dependent hydrolase